MATSGLLRRVTPNNVHSLAVAGAIGNLPPQDQPAATKDAHLVVMALTANAPVISLEIVSRRKFHAVCPYYPPLGSIVWVNPELHSPTCIQYVEGTTAHHPTWQLCHP
jgi:hypothetical protein